MKKKVFALVSIIVILIIILTVGMLIILNNKNNQNDTKTEELNWEEMYINSLKTKEDDIDIGLLDLNIDGIPELVIKSSNNLYTILSINKENKTIENIVKDEDIDNIELLYDYQSKKYKYGYITKQEPKKTKIFNENIKEVTQVDNSTDEYVKNNIIAL